MAHRKKDMFAPCGKYTKELVVGGPALRVEVGRSQRSCGKCLDYHLERPADQETAQDQPWFSSTGSEGKGEAIPKCWCREVGEQPLL